MNYSLLEDRILLYDGKNIVDPNHIGNLLLAGISPKDILTSELDEEILQFNELNDEEIKLFEEQKIDYDFNWKLPQNYLNLDLIEYFSKFITEYNEHRIIDELQIIIDHQLENHFRCMIYVIDLFKQNKIVWGVGRGSSVACYLLYLIGVHDIDSLKFDIPFTEFFHT